MWEYCPEKGLAVMSKLIHISLRLDCTITY